jgi:hypothetical protein
MTQRGHGCTGLRSAPAVSVEERRKKIPPGAMMMNASNTTTAALVRLHAARRSLLSVSRENRYHTPGLEGSSLSFDFQPRE